MRDSNLHPPQAFGLDVRSSAKVCGLVLLTVFCLGLVACGGGTPDTPKLAATPTLSPIPSPSSSPTRVRTPAPTVAAPALPTLGPLALPSPPPGAQFMTFSADPNRTGWLGSAETRPHWRDRSLFSGFYEGQSYSGILQFDLQTLAPGSKIYFAALEITGRDASNFQGTGQWSLDIVDSQTFRDDNLTYEAASNTTPLSTLAAFSDPTTFGAGVTQRFTFNSAQLALVEKQLEVGKLSFRFRGPTGGENNLFGWNALAGPGEPTLFLLATPAPFVVITVAPTPENVFVAATQAARQTAQASGANTPIPLSRAFITATPVSPAGAATSLSGYYIVTAVPTPANPTDALATSVYATAVAATTGTFTPVPSNWITATPRPLIIPRSSLTPPPTPTITATPMPGIIDIAKRPLPPGLYNKIIFMEGSRQNPNYWVMDPDGTVIGLLTDPGVYEIAKSRDSISPDGTRYVYQDYTLTGQLQLWIRNFNFPSALPTQLTSVRRGVVYGQAWSPDGKKIAYVSDELDHQEIYVWNEEIKKSIRMTYALGNGGDGSGWWWNQFPSWSPDGKQIIYSTDRGHDARFSEIWVMNADGSGQHNLGGGVWDAYNPVWVKWQR
ncbi:MAG: TolB family protein [Acidobacteriota bacterium]